MVTLQAAMMAILLSNPGQVELLDFYADWCGPCRAMQPTIQSLEAKGYPVKKVNIEQNRELAAQYNIQSVPCYVLVVDGKEVERISGGTSFSRLEKMFKTAAVRPAPPNGNRPGGAISIPAVSVGGNSNAAQATFQQPIGRPGNLQNNPSNGSFAAPGNQPNMPERDAQLIAASVRIRVEDPAGHSCGSGTIIDARGGKALVLTCGHIFRDSKGTGKIEIELFGPHAGKKVTGKLESYDSETRDIGLVSIAMPEPLIAARLAPIDYVVRKGDAVASVGCDHGADPTVRRNNVNSADPTNLWVADQPTEGRSGGGLFSAEGFVIGVCNGCDQQDREGLYAALGRICAQLDQVGLSFVYQSPQGWGSSAAAASPALLALGNPAGTNALVSGAPAASTPAISPASFAAGSSATVNASEQAALDEIRRHLKDGAEVVCVIRPRNAPDAKSEVIMLDKASPEFVKQLSLETQAKEGVQRTSMEVARPRKKLLVWSIDGNDSQSASAISSSAGRNKL
jgi:thiol-disulfide isomerase/thioredoxin